MKVELHGTGNLYTFWWWGCVDFILNSSLTSADCGAGKLVSVLFKILTLLLAVSLLENFSLSTYMLYIFSSWFVRGYDQEKCNDYEVRSVISLHDISLMILTLLFEGGTTWDGKFIHISTVGLCLLYIKLFTNLWYAECGFGKLLSVPFKILNLLLAVSLLTIF